MVKVENLVAIEKAFNVEVKFLGYLLWFTVADCRMTREQLQQVFVEAGLDEKYLPRPICPRDAFRRATKAGEVTKIEVAEDRFLNILVRDVKTDDTQIVKQVVREIVDSRNVRLEYTPVASLIFKDDSIQVASIMAIDAVEQQAIEEIQKAYEVEKENYWGRTVRGIIMDVLADCSPIAVRPSGGVYFVSQKHEGVLRSLQVFVGRVSDFSVTGFKSRFWTVPVIDTEEQRRMLQENLEEQVKTESLRLIEEMTDVIKSGRKITPHTAQQYVDRTKALAKMVREYEKLLQAQVIEARANLELAMKEAMKIMENVEAA